jgi:hypothetical protein
MSEKISANYAVVCTKCDKIVRCSVLLEPLDKDAMKNWGYDQYNDLFHKCGGGHSLAYLVELAGVDEKVKDRFVKHCKAKGRL